MNLGLFAGFILDSIVPKSIVMGEKLHVARITTLVAMLGLALGLWGCTNGLLSSSGVGGAGGFGNPFGLAATFDGATSTISLLGTSFTHNSSVTAEAFIITNSNVGTQNVFYVQLGGGNNFSIKIVGGLLQATVPDITGTAGSTLALNSPANVTTGQKHHVAMEYNVASNTTYLYLDGNLVLTQAGVNPAPSSSSTVQCIGSNCLGGNFFNGTIDEFRFSKTNRYGGAGANFMVPTAPFTPDAFDYMIFDFNTNTATGGIAYTNPGGGTYSGTGLGFINSPFP